MEPDPKELTLYTCRLGHQFEDYVFAAPGWCPRHDSRSDRCETKDDDDE